MTKSVSWAECSVPFGVMLHSPSMKTRRKKPRRLKKQHLGRLPRRRRHQERSNLRPEPTSVRLHLGIPGDGYEKLQPSIVPAQPNSGMYRFKISGRWCSDSKSGKIWRGIPFIDHIGQIHANTVGFWKCRTYELFGTILSTVHKRLWGVTRSYRKKFHIDSRLLYDIAAYYTITNHDSWFRRTLEMLKRRKTKELRNFVYRKLKHMDANTRFLYDQAQYAALWFQSRSERAPRREMSKQCSDVDLTSYSTLRVPPVRCSSLLIFDDLLRRWSGVYSGPQMKKQALLMLDSPEGKSAFIFRRIIPTRREIV